MIVMTIFGISLLDNFAFDFFSNFIKELKYITHNIILYITQTHFYVYLSEIFKGPSKDIVETTETPSREQTNISRKNTTDESWIKESQKGIKESNRDSKISEWLKPVKENIPNEQIEDTSFYDQWRFYILTGTIIVAGCFIWVYQDEIKSTWTSFYEWAMSFRPGPGDNSGNPTQNSGQHTRSNIQDRLKEALNKDLPSPVIELEDNLTKEVIKSSESIKGKEVLTSPSLEDLNNKAAKSWNEGTSSPGSDSSDITIKPLYSSEATSSKAKLVSIDELSPSESSVTGSIHKSSLDANLEDVSSSLTSTNLEKVVRSLNPTWKDLIKQEYSEKVKLIEFMFAEPRPIDTKTLMDLGVDYAHILNEYEEQVKTFINLKDSNNFSDVELAKIKEAAFKFRCWLASYNKLTGGIRE